MADEDKEIRCLMDTTIADGRPYVKGADEPQCKWCAKPFELGELWFHPYGMGGAHCEKCITDMQEETYAWYAAMDDWYEAQQEGQIDPDVRSPMEPMHSLPF